MDCDNEKIAAIAKIIKQKSRYDSVFMIPNGKVTDFKEMICSGCYGGDCKNCENGLETYRIAAISKIIKQKSRYDSVFMIPNGKVTDFKEMICSCCYGGDCKNCESGLEKYRIDKVAE